MATIHRYVDPTAPGSNTGIDWENAYTSIIHWNSVEAANLILTGDIHHVHCRGGTDIINSTISMSAWDANTTNYVIIEVDSDYRSTFGNFDIEKYNISKTNYTSGTSNHIFSARKYTKFRGVQFELNVLTGSNASRSCINPLSTSDGDFEIKDCIFSIGGNSSTHFASVIGLNSARINVFNNLIICNYTGSASNLGSAFTSTRGSAADDTFIYNNTLIDVSKKYKSAASLNNFTASLWKNNIFQGFLEDITFGGTGNITGSDYNLTSNPTFLTGSNNKVSSNLTFQLNSYKLTSTDTDAIGTALDDPGSGSFTTDALGVVRTSWDMGAFEFVLPSPVIYSINTSFIFANSSIVGITGEALTNGTYAKLVYANQEILMVDYVANSTQPYFTSPSLANVFTSRIQFTESANLQIVNSTNSIIASKIVSFIPSPIEKLVHNVTDISQAGNTGSIYYNQLPAITGGEQIVYDAKSSLTYNVAIDSQGYITIDSLNTDTTDSFTYRIYESSSQTWGAEGAITFTGGVVTYISRNIKMYVRVV